MGTINKYITVVSLNSLVGLSSLCQASSSDEEVPLAFDREAPAPTLDQDSASDEEAPSFEEAPAHESGEANAPEDDAVPAVEGWRNVKEMETDLRSYRDLDYSKKYTERIKGRIKATANVQVKDPQSIVPEERKRIDDATCMLYECRSILINISIVQKIMNPSNSENKQIVDNLIEVVENQMGKLTESVDGKK